MAKKKTDTTGGTATASPPASTTPATPKTEAPKPPVPPVAKYAGAVLTPPTLNDEERSILSILHTQPTRRVNRKFDEWAIPASTAPHADKKDPPPETITLNPDVARRLVDQLLLVPNVGQPTNPQLAEQFLLSSLGRAAMGEVYTDYTSAEEVLAFVDAPKLPVGQQGDYPRDIRPIISNWRFRQSIKNPKLLIPSWGWWSEFDVTVMHGKAKGTVYHVLYNPKKYHGASQFEFWGNRFAKDHTPENPKIEPDYISTNLEQAAERGDKASETPEAFAVNYLTQFLKKRAALKPETVKDDKPPLAALDADDNVDDMAELLGIG